jgi:Uncharacterized protein conserved in bacteria (DUF2188)
MNRITISENAEGGWGIRSSDTFRTQRDALTAARRSLGIAGGGELHVKGKNGQIRVEIVPATALDAPVAGSRRASIGQVWSGLNIAERIGLVLAGIVALSGAAKGSSELIGMAAKGFDDLTARRGPSVLVSPWLGAQIWQDGQALPLFTDGTELQSVLTVDVESKPFELRLPPDIGEEAFVQVCASTDPILVEPIEGTPEAIDPTVKGEHDDIYTQTDCLGWMRATARAPFETHLYLATDRNNSYTGQALRPVEGGYAVSISTVRDLSGERSMQDFHGPLYLILFIDEDSDEHVDNDEFDFVELDF